MPLLWLDPWMLKEHQPISERVATRRNLPTQHRFLANQSDFEGVWVPEVGCFGDSHTEARRSRSETPKCQVWANEFGSVLFEDAPFWLLSNGSQQEKQSFWGPQFETHLFVSHQKATFEIC